MTTTTSDIKSKTVLSVLSLFFQSGYSAFLGLIANLVLTILLSPAVFGIYITVLSIIALLNYFSDIGLAASLIQKKEIGPDDLKTTFTVQQAIILILIIIGFASTSFIQSFYRFPKEGVYLFWVLLVSFFVSSLKTIPSILLERKIQFQKIVFVQVIENTVFYLSAIVLALYGFGLTSFTIAVLLRAVSGLIVIYSLSFWLPKVGLSFTSLKNLLSFGLPFQASSFLALFKDDLIILFLGKVVGFEGLGYIGWAKKWAEAPIRIIMDNISRVLFPVLSRLQNQNDKISRIIEKFLYYQTLLLAPSIVGLALIMKSIVDIIPRYNKWEPALPLFYLFIAAAFFSSYSTPFMNLFNALGRVKIAFSFMLFWTTTTWLLTPFFTNMFGLYGYPITQFILSLSFFSVVYKAKRLVSFNFFQPIFPSLLTSLLMGTLTYFMLSFLSLTYMGVALVIFTSGVFYFIMLRFLFRIDIIKEFKSIISS